MDVEAFGAGMGIAEARVSDLRQCTPLGVHVQETAGLVHRRVRRHGLGCTSGGCAMFGGHCAKHRSSTQASIAFSSGEAAFAGVLRGAGQGLSYQALLEDLGAVVPLRVWTGSSTAIGICNRQRLRKLRHLDTHTFCIQQAVRTGRVDLRKVLGEENPADLLTKHSNSRREPRPTSQGRHPMPKAKPRHLVNQPSHHEHSSRA